uniref:Uncharacterized protein n=1 Tax=Lactuca sativa TaxID=4236 RepID=A0A9R1XSX5_LACSA|nr:hypothetical protein LSAT_V11C100037970 [Lactuca sativa]
MVTAATIGASSATICVTKPDNPVPPTVYEDDGEKKEEEEDALGYYKSWNHIIGGDLSPFQTTTGQYILNNMQFFTHAIDLSPYHRKFVPDGPDIQVEKERFWLRALSLRKPDISGRAHKGEGESSRSHPSDEKD